MSSKCATRTWRTDWVQTHRARFATYNGLANSRFHTLLFGINRLRSEEILHCRAKSACSGTIVQLLCNQKCDGFSDCCGTAATTSTEGIRETIAGGLLIFPAVFVHTSIGVFFTIT